MSSMESVVAISLGAALGANLRWVLSNELNAVLPHLPLGTLTANLIGAFLIGIGVALFAAMPALSAFWRLFFITGFLGALTTFSTFSAEVFSELQAGRWSWGVTGIVVHVAGSLLMVGFGMAVFFAVRQLLRSG
jgi:CrcB protein